MPIKSLKQTLLELMCATGAFAPFRIVNRAHSLIVMYHRFGDRNDSLTISRDAFEEQLNFLQAHYRIMPLGSIVDKLRHGHDVSSAIAITIDDGYQDAYQVAFPALVRHKVPATFFVTTDFIDRKAWLWWDKLEFLAMRARLEAIEVVIAGRAFALDFRTINCRLNAARRLTEVLKTITDQQKEETIARLASVMDVQLPELPPDEFGAATWDEVREMESGGIEIGSHSMSHPILTQIDERRLCEELVGSRNRLESELGHPVVQFCYPNGTYNDRVRQAVKTAGYRCAITCDPGFNRRGCDLLTLHRMQSGADVPHLAKNVSGIEQVGLYKGFHNYGHV